MTPLERFEDRIFYSPGGCHYWTGPPGAKGYGAFYMNGAHYAPSRAAYVFYKGDPGELYVCHACDNPLCVNPDHLFLGTAKDNFHDMLRKGRQNKDPNRKKLDHLSVLLIREAATLGFTLPEIASYFGVCFQTVSEIKLGLKRTYFPDTIHQLYDKEITTFPITNTRLKYYKKTKKSKIDPLGVLLLKEAFEAGFTITEIANYFKVAITSVSYIIKGKNRKHLPQSTIDLYNAPKFS